jgi:two-component sensor histidine kinase
MVSSLLYLQSENVKDVEAKMVIKEAQNRVRSMVLIHHKLYNKDQLIGINAKEYIEDLTKDIFESHQDLSKNIAFQLDVENIVLSVDTITPIGLILNELIINVLKHAFNKNAADVLMKISFGRKEEVLILEVSDNGDGFEEGQGDYSFGLKLIRSLARKLEATLLINSELGKGTNTRLSIKEFEILS